MKVGEIHADVRTLLEREKSNTSRIHEIEKNVDKRTYMGIGLLFILSFADPKQWLAWVGTIKGLIF